MNLLKAMALTLRDILMFPVFIVKTVAFRTLLGVAILIGAPIVVSVFFGYHNWGFAVLMLEFALGLLAMIAAIRYGRFERSEPFGSEVFVGWNFNKKENR